MITHLNFDIETLGIRPTSIILSMACIAFKFEDDTTYDQYILDGFYVKFDPTEQLRKGRTTDQETINWWKTQTKEARDVTKPSLNDVNVDTGLNMLRHYIEQSDYDWKTSYCWCRGNYFDFPMMEDLHRSARKELPYNTWKIRDIRTMIDVLTGSMKGEYHLPTGTPKNWQAHHALHDTALDIMRMKSIFKGEHQC